METDFKILEGKTISKAVAYGSGTRESLYLITSESEILCISACAGYEGDTSIEVDLLEKEDLLLDTQLAVGLITEKDYEELHAKMEHERKVRLEQRERAEYEMLKKKFEGSN
jgi:hypothetical protein